MSCPDRTRLAAAIDGELTANAQRTLDSHLADCPECEAATAHLRALRSALPDAFDAGEDTTFWPELERRLEAHAPSRRIPFVIGGTLTAALAFAVLVVLTPAVERSEEGALLARGDPASPRSALLGADFFAHRGGPTDPGVLLAPGATVDPDTGFSFVLYNRTGSATRFMLFARDAEGELHWFYPAWRAVDAPSRAPLLDGARSVVSLPEGVTPDRLPRGRLELVALFSHEALSVLDVETALADGRPLDSLAAHHPLVTLQPLTVTVTVTER